MRLNALFSKRLLCFGLDISFFCSFSFSMFFFFFLYLFFCHTSLLSSQNYCSGANVCICIHFEPQYYKWFTNGNDNMYHEWNCSDKYLFKYITTLILPFQLVDSHDIRFRSVHQFRVWTFGFYRTFNLNTKTINRQKRC